jgi:hypothetical protein
MKLLKVAISDAGFRSYAEFGRVNNISRSRVSQLVDAGCFVDADNVLTHKSGAIGAIFSFDKVEAVRTRKEEELFKHGWKGTQAEFLEVSGVTYAALKGWLETNKIERIKLAVDAALWRVK